MPGIRDDYPEQHAWKFERQLWDYLKSIGVRVQKRAPTTYNNLDTVANEVNNPMKNPEIAARVGAKNSEKLTGVPLSSEHCEAISAGQTRRYENPDERRKTSEALTGVLKTAEHCAAISAARKTCEKAKEQIAELHKLDKKCSCGHTTTGSGLTRHIKAVQHFDAFVHYRVN
jgi:hypothetical protein